MTKSHYIKTKRFFSSRTIVLGLLVIFILIVWAVINNLSNQSRLDEKAAQLDQEIAALEKQNTELVDLIDYFASTEYIEKEAREKLNLARPGEKMVVVTEGKDVLKQDTNQDFLAGLDGLKPWQKWWKYFFGR